MTYAVTDKCIKCKFTDCVEVCPVDAFHEGENMLIINPSVCIDCGLCEPECPADAIITENSTDPMLEQYISFAEDMAEVWPVLVEQINPMENAEAEALRPDKWNEKSTTPGEGS